MPTGKSAHPRAHDCRIVLPDHIEPLIEAVYDEQRLCPSDLSVAWQREWTESLADLVRERAEAETAAEQCLIKPPQAEHEGSLYQVCTAELEEDAPDIHPAFQAKTRRETRPSVSVVCLLVSPEGTRLTRDGLLVRIDDEPDHLATEAFIRRSVSISHGGIVRSLLADNSRVPKSWRKNSLLRGQRVLEFNADAECDVGDFRLKLDPELGLLFLSPNADEDL